MKLRSLVLLAALGFGLTACNNDGDDLLKDEESKSVTISLANVLPQSKGTGTQIPEENKKVTLNDYYVVFTDGTNLYGGYDLTPEGKKDNAEKYYNATTLSKTFHFVNGAANQAIVIGNVGGVEGALKKQLDGCSTLAALKALVCQMSEEQDEKDLTLYGTGNFVKKGSADDEQHTNVYTAAINVKPLIARIEVTGFKYAKVDPQTDAKYSKILLNKIAIDNYYPAVQLDGTYSGELSFYDVPATGNSQNFFESLTSGWTNDDFAGVELMPTEEKTAADILGEGKDAYVYHVAAGATIPHILLQMQGVPAAGGDNVPLHIVARGLLKEGSPVNKLEAGKVYRLSFEFNDNDLEQPAKCVEVTVTVADWVVEVVTPQF